MSSLATSEVSPNLLASSRMQLQEALEHAQQNRSFWGMFIFDFAGWMQQIKLAPYADAVAQRFHTDWSTVRIDTPAFIGSKVLDDYPLEKLGSAWASSHASPWPSLVGHVAPMPSDGAKSVG